MSTHNTLPLSAERERPIGVFDSGVGGLSVLLALRDQLPGEDFVYYADSGYAPYGERSEAYVQERTLTVAEALRTEHQIKALVVACNTATAAAIALLRERWPQMPLVGVEPALKPAVALSRTGHIAVLATRGTLQSEKFARLHRSLAGAAQFHLVPGDGLADAIERYDAIKIIAISDHCMRACGKFGFKEGEIDTLVLGCTHYPFAEAVLRRSVPEGVQFIETGAPVARHTRQLLAARQLLRPAPASSDEPITRAGRMELLSSGDGAALRGAAERWLNTEASTCA